jgi:hypothetical protein
MRGKLYLHSRLIGLDIMSIPRLIDRMDSREIQSKARSGRKNTRWCQAATQPEREAAPQGLLRAPGAVGLVLLIAHDIAQIRRFH